MYPTLSNIQETRYMINGDIEKKVITSEKLSCQIGVKISHNLEKNILAIETIVSYNLEDKEESFDLLELGVLFNYNIPNLANCISRINNEIKFNDESLLINLLNINIGTIRGILFTKTKGTCLEKYPLPLLGLDTIKLLTEDYLEKNDKTNQ